MTRSNRLVGVSMLVLGALVLCSLPLVAAESSTPTLNHPMAFGAGRVPNGPPPTVYGFHEANPARRIPKRQFAHVQDAVQQHNVAPSSEFSLLNHWLGVGNGFPGYSVPDAPPDTTMAVGDTEVVQWVNVSYADFNKSTGAIKVLVEP